MKKLKYIEFRGNVALDTGIIPNYWTSVECWLTPISYAASYWDVFFGAERADGTTDAYKLRRFERSGSGTTNFTWHVQIGNSEPPYSQGGVGTFETGTTYHVLFNKDTFQVDGTELFAPSPSQNFYPTYSLYIGASHNNWGLFRPFASNWGDIEIVDLNTNTVLASFSPVLDDNDEPAFYDSISGNYFYKTGTGTWTAGPLATTLLIDPEELAFDSTGGSQTISVTSNTAWHVDTNDVPSWLTLSPLSGVDGDTITATTSLIMSSNVPDRSASITISNEEDDAELSVSQKGTGTLFFPDKIMFNDRGLKKEYLETNNVKKMYYNGREVFRRVSFMPTLSVDTNALNFKKTGGTETVGISSNTTWSATTSASWLTITTAATGISVTAADYSTGETERNTTVLVTASNGDFTVSETINVVQTIYDYTELAWISNANAGYSWNYANCLTIPIVLKTNSTMRLLYEGKNGNATATDRLAGYTWQEDDIYGNRISDNADWRGMGTNLYDVGPGRTYIAGDYGQYSDLTFGNFYVYDNNSQRNIASGLVQTITTEAYCRVDLDCIKVKGFYISEGSTEVFHGVPAMDRDGHVGLWDTITETLYYNPDQTMTYGEIE